MNQYLKEKGIRLSAQAYLVKALSFMALGLFSSLLIGLIIKTLGENLNLTFFIEMGEFAMDSKIYGAAIGAAIAYSLEAPPLILFSTVFVGAFGAQLGGPVGSYVAALIATELGKLVYQLTRVDIIVVPFTVFIIGYFTAKFIGIPVDKIMTTVGEIVNWSTAQQPFLMSILVATIMGLALTAPISSAAIAFMLGLEGLAAGAAVIGCSAQMVGFAIISYKENGFSGLIAQGIGTSMLQIGNIIQNPLILIPPTLAGIITAPIAIGVFKMANNTAGAGMGTSGLVGQFMAFETMGFSLRTTLLVLLFHIVLPVVISLLSFRFMLRKGWVNHHDLKLIYD